MKKSSRNVKETKKSEVTSLTLEIVNKKFALCDQNGDVLASGPNKWYVASKRKLYGNVPYADKTTDHTATHGARIDKLAEDNPALAFPIDQRFKFLGEFVKMVANRQVPSVIITGEGGLGKSYTVMQSLKEAGLRDLNEMPTSTNLKSSKVFKVIKGYSSTRGLYEALFDNREGVIVFDDCDSVWDDSDAANILKAALDSYDNRYISWNTAGRPGDTYPKSFKFEGVCIFISNLPQTKMDQAVRTRAMCIDVSMTTDQKLQRMEEIMNKEEFLPSVDLKFKKEAFNLIKEHKENVRDLSMRTLIAITRIRVVGNDDWKDQAAYLLVN